MVAHSQRLPGEPEANIGGRGTGLTMLDSSAASGSDAQSSKLMEEALKLLDLGLRPFPVNPLTKKPLGDWKALQDTPPTKQEIARTFGAYPRAAIALVTGHPGGLDVLDLDVDENGDLPQWPSNPNLKLPGGLVIRTPRGGLHYVFAHIDGVRNSTGRLAPRVDVRGTGGYFVAAGPGREIVRGSFAEALNTQASQWLHEALLLGTGNRPHTTTGTTFSVGERNTSLTSLAGTMRRQGISEAAITAALLEENVRKCSPPLTEAEVRAIAQSVGRYAPGDSAHTCTDSGNSQRFVRQWKDVVRWCAPLNCWLVWDSCRWAVDNTERLTDMAKQTARTIYMEAAAAHDDAWRGELGKWARLSEQASRLEAMVKLAKPDLAILPDALDSAPLLFNCANGTLDLRTGELQKHNPGDYITKLAPVEYHPDARDPVWERFLDDTTGGDVTFARYLQRFVGYCLTGRTDEEIFALILGPSSTGKTTLVQALLAVAGDYGVKAQFDSFLERHDVGGPRSDLAALRGTRIVAAVETSATRRLAEPLVKELVGGDSVTVSAKYAHPITFKPQCKLILAANEAPRMSCDDGALWRRAKMLPFEHVITRPDPAIKAHLSKPNEALLAWAVHGCLMWQRDRLSDCVVVSGRTETLRSSMNPLAGFLESCSLGDQYKMPTGGLRQAYEDWADQEGIKPIRGKALARALQSAGCRSVSRKVDGRTVRYWLGIGLQHLGDESVTGESEDG